MSLTAVAAAQVASMDDAAAVESAYSINGGVGSSDNISRVSTNETSETIATVGASLQVRQESTRLKTDIAGDFSYLDYLDNTYDNEVLGSFSGSLVAGFVPDKFEWIASDSFGQATTQPLQAVTPENRENVNFFSTGPRLRLGSGWLETRLDARISEVDYEKTALDNQRYVGDLAFLHQISPATALSLNAHYDQVQYDDAAFSPDFERKEGYLRYALSQGRTGLSLDAGFTEVGGDVEKESGFLGRFQMSRNISQASALAMSLGREISDAGQSFRQLQTTPGADGTQPVQPTGSPFVNVYATLGWSFERGRTGLGASVARYDESYDDSPEFDRTRTTFGVRARRDIGPKLRGTVAVDRSEEKFDQTGQKFSEISASIDLRWSVGAHLALNLTLEHFDRDDGSGSSSPADPSLEYTENRAWLRLSWGFGSITSDRSAVPIDTGSYR